MPEKLIATRDSGPDKYYSLWLNPTGLRITRRHWTTDADDPEEERIGPWRAGGWPGPPLEPGESCEVEIAPAGTTAERDALKLVEEKGPWYSDGFIVWEPHQVAEDEWEQVRIGQASDDATAALFAAAPRLQAENAALRAHVKELQCENAALRAECHTSAVWQCPDCGGRDPRETSANTWAALVKRGLVRRRTRTYSITLKGNRVFTQYVIAKHPRIYPRKAKPMTDFNALPLPKDHPRFWRDNDGVLWFKITLTRAAPLFDLADNADDLTIESIDAVYDLESALAVGEIAWRKKAEQIERDWTADSHGRDLCEISECKSAARAWREAGKQSAKERKEKWEHES